MGNFQHEPVMPTATHVGYVEGYLDALEKVLDFQKRHPTMSVEDPRRAFPFPSGLILTHIFFGPLLERNEKAEFSSTLQ